MKQCTDNRGNAVTWGTRHGGPSCWYHPWWEGLSQTNPALHAWRGAYPRRPASARPLEVEARAYVPSGLKITSLAWLEGDETRPEGVRAGAGG